MKMLVLAAAVIVAISSSGYAQSDSPYPAGLVNSWNKENSSCRGTRGADPDTFPPCLQRQKLGQQLTSMGYCFGLQGQASAAMIWHRCRSDSNGGVPGQANASPQNQAIDVQQLVNSWNKENSSCRGTPGANPDTFPACQRRQAISQQLGSMGYCYGKQGEAGYQMEWHRCGPTSNKSNQARSNAAPQTQAATPQEMISLWQKENSSCRGTPGANPDTFPPCLQRQKITQQLTAAGYCYGKQGEAGYQMEWHRCGATSNKMR